MRLFGLIGGTLEEARATYWFTPPFDLTFAAPQGNAFTFGAGGVAFDLSGTLAWYGQIMLGFPDFVFVVPTAVFNQGTQGADIQGVCIDTDQGITASTPNTSHACIC